MANLWLKIKIWFKVALVAALFIYVILFTYNNSREPVQFWYWFHRQPRTNLLLLVVCTFIAGMIAAFLIRTTLRTMRQIQEVQSRARAQRIDREIADIKAKAAMLQTRPASAATPQSPASSIEEEH